MSTKLAILDFDGTLGDTRQVIVDSILDTIQALNLPTRSPIECQRTIGLPLTQAAGFLYPDSTADDRQRYEDTYRVMFRKNNVEGAVPLFPGVLDTLRELDQRGVVLAIASSRSHASLCHYVHDLGIEEMVRCVVGAEDVEEVKPSPVPALKILNELGFQPDEAIVVGDTFYDILMGVRAGIPTIGVTYGNGTAEELSEAGATHLVDRFSDILRYVVLNEHRKEEYPPMHSAEHLLNGEMARRFGCGRAFSAHVEKKKTKLDYRLPKPLTEEEVKHLEDYVNQAIAADVEVGEEYITREEARQRFDLQRLPEEASDTLRVVHIGPYDQCLCAGTHVKRSSEIGVFRISSSRWQDGVQRIVFRLDESK